MIKKLSKNSNWKNDKIFIKVPRNCPVCNTGYWIGGFDFPGRSMIPGLRVFFTCGSSLSIELYPDRYLLKGCTYEED